MTAPQLTRRHFLQRASAGFGYLAFAGMATDAAARDAGPLAPRAAHFPARAKRVIFLCMRGGPSHMETFDPKPVLSAQHGNPGRLPGTKLLGSRFKFARHGQSGIDIVELMPELARHADKLCVLRGMNTDSENHPQALEQLHTGNFQFVRPSLGAWTVYGLGSENANLPGFISINPLTALGGNRYYSSAFLPAACSATMLGNASLPAAKLALDNLTNPRLTNAAQRRQLDLLQAMNRDLHTQTADPRVDGIIESYELAFRMQGELPRVMDLGTESKATLQMYGADKSPTETFGKQCLLARRFAEAGVRFIEISHGEWDLHGGLVGGMTRNCSQIDKPIAGLLEDLAQRGLLEDTLVLWGGEFGRTPEDATTDGRGHNNKGYSMWMAGGGARAGHIHGATDDFGREAIDGKIHTHDLHATLLHLLGLDHEKLTYRHGGRDYRLTDLKGNVVREIIG